MRLNLQSHHGPAGLFAACTLLSSGCASILGADFDKPFQPDGEGGAGGSMVPATASSTVTGPGGSGGTGGMGGAGGSGPIASCPDQPDESTGFCTVHVYVKRVDPVSIPMDYTTKDAILTFDSAPPAGYEKAPTSTFLLSRASLPSDSTALYSCFEEDDKTHTLAMNSPCGDSTFLGYLSSSSVSSVPSGYTVLPLEWFNTGTGLGAHDDRRALIALTAKTSFCGPMPYGSCGKAPYFALTK